MDAPRRVPVRIAFLLVFLLSLGGAVARPLAAASVQTRNFEVHAASTRLAEQLGRAAEQYRKELAVEWLGRELPPWNERCPIVAKIKHGAGGVTSFCFTRGRVHGWNMEITGSPERMLDSVLPHEVTHTIFATHFGCPLPRWADEGACTTVEHPGEIARLEKELIKFLKTRRGIRFSDMMWIKEYPSDLMPLYAQGHSVAAYLIEQKGKRAFVRFLEDGLTDDNWPRAIKARYGYANLTEMQASWMDWIRAGRPLLDGGESGEAPRTELIADTRPAASTGGRRFVRAQEQAAANGGAATAARELAAVDAAVTQVVAVDSGGQAQEAVAKEPPASLVQRDSVVSRGTRVGVAPQVASHDRVVFQWQAPGID